MSKKIIFCILLCLLPTIVFANNNIKRVIYITLDGVRWQDVFLDHSYFSTFWEKYAHEASIYGEPESQTTMEVASVPISLPSYQSQMSGAVQPCRNNQCGRIQATTFPEALVTEFGLNKRDVAIISSWEPIDYAIESIPNTAFSNNGTRPMFDPDTLLADEVMLEINQQQVGVNPGDDTRLDQYTFSQALHYLEKYQPRFLWIMLGDADQRAHANDLEAYHQALYFYDSAIHQVITLLKKLNLDQETMIIITTDHGRGDGINWTKHGEAYPESKQTWAFVINGHLKPVGRNGVIDHYSTLSIRPTIEAALK